MSKKFAIRSNRPLQQKQGDNIIFGTGTEIPFSQKLTPFTRKIGRDHDGDLFEYQTGLEEKHINNSPLYNAEEKAVLIKELKEDLKEILKTFYKEEIDSRNNYFWKDRVDFIFNNQTLESFFDTKTTDHFFLYWKIKSGAYAEGIAPTYEIAQQHGIPYYLTPLEEQAERETEEVGFKGKAYAALEEMSEKKNTEDLLWLSWILLEASAGYSKSTPKATLYKALFEFIEGKRVKKAKKLCAKQFTEAVTLLKTDRTRAIAKAVVKAGDWFALIFTNKEGKLQIRKDNTILGETVEEAVETLLKPTNQEILEELRIEIEDKL